MGVIIGPFVDVISLLVNVYFHIVVVEIVLHWLIHFKILSVNNPYAKKFMEILEMVTHPVYKKIAEKFPSPKASEFAPFLLLLALFFVGQLMYRLNLALM